MTAGGEAAPAVASASASAAEAEATIQGLGAVTAATIAATATTTTGATATTATTATPEAHLQFSSSDSHYHDDTTSTGRPQIFSPLSLSTPTTAASPVSPSFLPVADRVGTPMSLFIDSAPNSSNGKALLALDDDPDSAAMVRKRYLAMSPLSPTGRKMAETSTDLADKETRRRREDEEGDGSSSSRKTNTNNTNNNNRHDIARGVISGPLLQHQSPNARARARQHEHERPPNANSNPNPNPKHNPNSARDSAIATSTTGTSTSTTTGTSWSPAAGNRLWPSEEAPLHTGSVQPGTKLAHPKPILHIATDAAGFSTSFSSSRQNRHHHHSDLATRSASAVSNIAHLEATAERLSMTSSIDDAIRELHGELKRSDSRRSSILAARAASADEYAATGRPGRHASTTSSSAARHNKAYSPAAHVMSPTSSLSGRMRSGSNASAGRPEYDVINSILPRHGPGKSSVRSVRSGKPSLAEISESEPISLTQHVLDEVDAAPPPIDHAREIIEQDAVGVPHTDEFHQMLEGGFRHRPGPSLVLVNPDLPPPQPQYRNYDTGRPMTANSVNTFQVAQEAFVDFDGAHCETDNEDEHPYAPLQIGSGMQQQQHQRQQELEPLYIQDDMPTPRQPSAEFVRPQTYFDQQTGQQMLYYPARVPAMLNLPPKLSNKPKAADRDQRRSQIPGAMPKDNRRKSVVPDLDQFALPDPLSGHRNSFAALSVADKLDDADPTAMFLEGPVPQPEGALSLDDLGRPQRLTDADRRKSNMTNLDTIPPHHRASGLLDLSDAPEVEIRDGSAMATLDSILDASAHAPVSAFTDHLFAGHLGSEVYGKEKKKKHKSQILASSSLEAVATDPPAAAKRRSSPMLFGKRSHNSLLGGASGLEPSAALSGAGEDYEGQALDNVDHHGETKDEEAEQEEELFEGMPNTLLGELQLRKQRQKERLRIQNNVRPEGLRATLLEMDAVAEQQRQQRSKGRVNLAWEEQHEGLDANGSDDDDVPLAVIAAMHQGAKNLADLERPLGLMEIRQIEENEPLSQRAARLQGRGSLLPPAKRQSVLSLPVTRMAEVQPPAGLPRVVTPEPERRPVAVEIEEETLGARKRRLAEGQLPKARPVSSAFSAELLSQFGDLDDAKDKNSKSPNMNGEEETLGQRRRRLQAEREAREREMSYGNLTGETGKKVARRVSMADMLSVHHRVAEDPRMAEERRRREEQTRVASQDARMAAMRNQMPTVLTGPGSTRAGGFRGGLYNDGTGGVGLEGARSSAALNTLQSRSFTNTGPRNRMGLMATNGYGPPMPQSSYGGLNTMSMYGAGNLYGAKGLLQPVAGMPMSMLMNNGSMDRVESWRQSVLP